MYNQKLYQTNMWDNFSFLYEGSNITTLWITET